MDRDAIKVAVDAFLSDPTGFETELANRSEETRGHFGSFKPGSWLFVRTLTYHMIGKLVAADAEKLSFRHCWMVRNTPSWFESLTNRDVERSRFPESCEPVLVMRHNITDAFNWPHADKE